MALTISTLIPYLRLAIDDNDPSGDYENTDAQLITNLRFAILASEADWNQNYSIQQTEGVYEIIPDPPSWLQILYVIKCAIMMRSFERLYSYQIPAIKITRTSKGEDLDSLQKIYDAIIQERRYATCGYVFTSFDDLFTRPNLILSEIEKGYR
jgi:hypothetical protein